MIEDRRYVGKVESNEREDETKKEKKKNRRGSDVE